MGKTNMTKFDITYFADDASMGDTSANDCDKFREWAERELMASYPDHNITVSDKPSLYEAVTDDHANEDEIAEFCRRLWGICPWHAL